MNSTLKLILPAVAAMTFISVQPVAAFWPFDNLTNKSAATQSTLLDRIITKFNLNKNEVDQVVADYRTEKRQQMQANYQERLDQAVKDNKITEEQKQLILEKHNQLQSELDTENIQRQQHREEMQSWAKDNNIDVSYLGLGRGGRGGMMRGEGMGMVRGW